MTPEAQKILDLYRQWDKVGNESPLWRWLLPPAHVRASDLYQQIHMLANMRQDAVIELILDGHLSDSDALGLVSLMGHGGSVAKNYNLNMVEFYATLRTHRDELSESWRVRLDWLWRVQGY